MQLTPADAELLALVYSDAPYFAKFWFDADLMPHQRETVEALKRGSVAVRSGNGVGKTATAAHAAVYWLFSNPNSMVLTTAPTFRQVKEVLWPELHRLHMLAADRTLRLPSGIRIEGGLGPPPKSTSWEVSPGWMALGVSANRKENLQGFHPKNRMLVIADEASGIADTIYEGILSVTTGANDRILAIGNPTRAGGWFHRIFTDPKFGERWIKLHLDTERMPWIVAGTAPPFPGLVDSAWVNDRLAECGGDREDTLYQVHVRGNFPDVSEEFLCTLYQAENVCNSSADAQHQPGRPSILAADIARGGRSRTTLAWARGNVITRIVSFRIADLTEVAARVLGEWERDRTDAVVIDSDGLGVGVFDILRAHKRFPIMAFHGNAEPLDPRKYTNTRAEGFGWLSDDIIDERIRVDADSNVREVVQRFCMQMAYIKKKWHPKDGRMMIESKDDMARDGKASPDEADAVMMARWGQRRFIRAKRTRKVRLKAV